MSWESSIDCDVCSEIIGGGRRRDILDTLRETGGRAFGVGPKVGTWVELAPDADWSTSGRHVCGNCAEGPYQAFFDGTAVPRYEP